MIPRLLVEPFSRTTAGGSGFTMTKSRAYANRRKIVMAENAHPFEDPPLRMNDPFGLFGLTS